MQRTIRQSLIAGFAVLMLGACSSSKNSTATASRGDLKGTWLLENITYDGVPQGQKVKLTLLDEGSENCLKGSTWVLPNNGNGTYSIAENEAGCIPGERNIVWSYRQENGQTIFQFKRLPGGVKAKDVAEGYRFNVMSASDTRMVLRSTVPYETQQVNINYEFSKKN